MASLSSAQVPTSNIVILGPEASGCTTLVQQLKHWASSNRKPRNGNSDGRGRDSGGESVSNIDNGDRRRNNDNNGNNNNSNNNRSGIPAADYGEGNPDPESFPCSTIADPSLLVTAPTTGQEIEEIHLRGFSALSPFPLFPPTGCSSGPNSQQQQQQNGQQQQLQQARAVIDKLNEECVSCASGVLEQEDHDEDGISHSRRLTEEAVNRAVEPLAKCFASDDDDDGDEDEDNNEDPHHDDNNNKTRYHTKSRKTSSSVSWNLGGSAAVATTKNNPLRAAATTTLSPTFSSIAFHTNMICHVKEFGGRMAQLWSKFLKVSTSQFDKCIFVVDVTTPQVIPLASIEFWNCALNLFGKNDSASSSTVSTATTTTRNCQLLVYVNKIRCPVIIHPSDVLDAMFLTQGRECSSSDDDSIRERILKNTSIVVGDTWSGEGIPLVVAWLLRKC